MSEADPADPAPLLFTLALDSGHLCTVDVDGVSQTIPVVMETDDTHQTIVLQDALCDDVISESEFQQPVTKFLTYPPPSNNLDIPDAEYCDICHQSFPKHNFNRHRLTHSASRPFECEFCNKRFTRTDHLKDHIRIHTGEKPYKCAFCDFACIEKKGVRSHMRNIHTGEKPYGCDICSMGFSTKGRLTEHTYTHTGEKPFLCTICDKNFRRKAHLNEHLRRHKVNESERLPCTICNRTFPIQSELKRHIKNRHLRIENMLESGKRSSMKWTAFRVDKNGDESTDVDENVHHVISEDVQSCPPRKVRKRPTKVETLDTEECNLGAILKKNEKTTTFKKNNRKITLPVKKRTTSHGSNDVIDIELKSEPDDVIVETKTNEVCGTLTCLKCHCEFTSLPDLFHHECPAGVVAMTKNGGVVVVKNREDGEFQLENSSGLMEFGVDDSEGSES